MPYVYYDELEDGMEAAEVKGVEEYNALEAQRTALQEQYDTLVTERDSLSKELMDAKTKFANAFLSSPQKMKQDNADDLRHEDVAMSYDQLFAERGRNAN